MVDKYLGPGLGEGLNTTNASSNTKCGICDYFLKYRREVQ